MQYTSSERTAAKLMPSEMEALGVSTDTIAARELGRGGLHDIWERHVELTRAYRAATPNGYQEAVIASFTGWAVGAAVMVNLKGKNFESKLETVKSIGGQILVSEIEAYYGLRHEPATMDDLPYGAPQIELL